MRRHFTIVVDVDREDLIRAFFPSVQAPRVEALDVRANGPEGGMLKLQGQLRLQLHLEDEP